LSVNAGTGSENGASGRCGAGAAALVLPWSSLAIRGCPQARSMPRSSRRRESLVCTCSPMAPISPTNARSARLPSPTFRRWTSCAAAICWPTSPPSSARWTSYLVRSTASCDVTTSPRQLQFSVARFFLAISATSLAGAAAPDRQSDCPRSRMPLSGGRYAEASQRHARPSGGADLIASSRSLPIMAFGRGAASSGSTIRGSEPLNPKDSKAHHDSSAHILARLFRL
jgi:hypothetical protein